MRTMPTVVSWKRRWSNLVNQEAATPRGLDSSDPQLISQESSCSPTSAPFRDDYVIDNIYFNTTPPDDDNDGISDVQARLSWHRRSRPRSS